MKKRILWWYVWRIRKLLDADKLEQRFIAITTVKTDLVNTTEELGEKSSFVFTGTIKDSDGETFSIMLQGIQIFEIKLWKHCFIRLLFGRTPTLFNQIYIEDVPLISGRWYNKLNFPKSFKR